MSIINIININVADTVGNNKNNKNNNNSNNSHNSHNYEIAQYRCWYKKSSVLFIECITIYRGKTV